MAVQGFSAFEQFFFSSTGWILYLSFGYRLIRDRVVSQRVEQALKDENRVLKQTLEHPDEIKTFLSTVSDFADRFTAKKRWGGDYFFVNSGSEYRKIDLGDLLYVEGSGNYVKYHLTSGNILERSSLKETLAMLSATAYVQIQRSYVVSLAKIDKIKDNHVFIGDSRLSIGPSYKEEFMRAIEGLSLG